MSSPPTTTPWVPMWGGAGGPSPIAATADCTLVAGDQDVSWPTALGDAINCVIWVKGLPGFIRRLGTPPGGPGTVVRLVSSSSDYPGFTLRHNAASGVGDPFWLWPNADQVIPIQGMVTLVWDGGYWSQVSEAPYQPDYVTALPATAYPGQEIILVDSVTAPNYQWRLRYNALATGNNKWECIGGMSKTVQYWGNINISIAAAWAAIPTMPALTAPYPGTYEVRWGASTLQKGSITAHITFIGIADGYSLMLAGPAVPSNSVGYPVGEIYPEWGISAGGSIQIGTKSAQAQTWTLTNPWTSIMPKRLRLS